MLASAVEESFCADADLKERRDESRGVRFYHCLGLFRHVIRLSDLLKPPFTSNLCQKARSVLAVFLLNRATTFLTTLRYTFIHLATLPIPTLSTLAAPTLGGGFELVLYTHLRIFSSIMIVGLPETRLAIIPGVGGTHHLPALIGASPHTDGSTGRGARGASNRII